MCEQCRTFESVFSNHMFYHLYCMFNELFIIYCGALCCGWSEWSESAAGVICYF